MNTSRIGKVGTDKRIGELKELIERDPLNVGLRLQLAASLEAAGKIPEALKCLGDTLEKARRNLGVSHCNYAVMLMKAGKPEAAFTHYDQAIECDPANASFYLSSKAHALTQVGLHDKAKAIYEQILDRRGTSKETQRIVLKKMGDIPKEG